MLVKPEPGGNLLVCRQSSNSLLWMSKISGTSTYTSVTVAVLRDRLVNALSLGGLKCVEVIGTVGNSKTVLGKRGQAG